MTTDDDYILIEAGIIESSPYPRDIGQHCYFVTVVEKIGTICLWSGPSFADAQREAHEAAEDWDGIEVVDRTNRSTLQ